MIRPLPRPTWRLPLLAAALTAVLAGGVYLALLPRLQRTALPLQSPPEPALPLRHIESGRQKLAEGRFRRASEEFDAAIRLLAQHPELLSPTENRQLHQLQRQSDLLARLLSPSLQEILREAIDVRHEDEWQARFNDDYRGRAVVFDDVLRRDENGLPVLHFYEVRAGEETARVALEDLALLQHLPLDPPQRLLFGARLANLAREKGGRWVFRLQPESAVLLTDPDAVAACGLGPLDAELLEVLRRQEEWLRR